MTLTILCDCAEHPLEDVIVDNDIQETEAIEVPNESQGNDGCSYKQLGYCGVCMCVCVCVCVCVRVCVCVCTRRMYS